jgi:hypothetical protein
MILRQNSPPLKGKQHESRHRTKTVQLTALLILLNIIVLLTIVYLPGDIIIKRSVSFTTNESDKRYKPPAFTTTAKQDMTETNVDEVTEKKIGSILPQNVDSSKTVRDRSSR